MAKNKTSDFTCSCCGKSDNLDRWSLGDIRYLMLKKHLCFECALWENHIKLDKTRDFAIINGKHYVLEPHTDQNWPKGFGGAKFKIKFLDGREVVCDNLWHQGEIPSYFRDRMPDNAVFIKEEGYSWME